MSALPAIALLTRDSPALLAQFPPQWGIFDQFGSPIIVADSVRGIRYARDYQISDYPQERGAFASYNKVQVPFQAKVGFLIGPSRFDFLNLVEAAVASLQLVTVVTPEIFYPSANLTHYDYARDERSGVTMIRVDVWCEEVRVTAGQQVSSTASQGQAAAGTTSPVGQSNTLSPGGALTTQSTNAAYPASSGNVQGVEDNTPGGSNWKSLTPAQQQGIVDYGRQTGATKAFVGPPDANGNARVTYQYPG